MLPKPKTEKYALVCPFDLEEYNPILDLKDTCQMLVKYCVPNQSQEFGTVKNGVFKNPF